MASGKVINVARACRKLAARYYALTVVGGATGRSLQSAALAERLQLESVPTRTPTRVCTTLLDRQSGQATELVENCAAITAAELDDFLTRTRAAIGHASVVVITGSLPQGTSASCWTRVLESDGPPLIADVRGESLQQILPLRPWLVKPNAEELMGTTGAHESALWPAMQRLRDQGAQRVLVTRGAQPSLYLSAQHRTRFHVPLVPLDNPIGSGDCVAAGVAHGVAQGLDELAVVTWGLACGSANAETRLPAEFERSRVRTLLELVVAEE